jgi:ubiquinol-cytochrome c reductase cytochrome b subunit
MTSLKQRGIDLDNWFEQRLGLATPAIEMVEHEVPSNTSSWWYIFGSAATVILVLQVVTGILLALAYAPSASHAWSSLEFLDHNVRLGWFLGAMHGWGSDFMVAIVLIHLAQVFLFGAYKFPRELTWIIGVFLLLLTLGMAFTGQVLRFDQDAYWGLGIGASIVSRVPRSAVFWWISCWAAPSSVGRRFPVSSLCMSLSCPVRCWRWSACTCGWCCASASTTGPCPDAWSTKRPT